MADQIKVNGVLYDWECATFTGPHGTFIGITEVSWKSKKEVELRYGKGSLPRGVGRGNYEPECSLTLDADEFKRLNAALDGGVYKTPFDISGALEPPGGEKITVVLKGVRVTGKDRSGKQGDKDAWGVKLDCKCMMVEEDGAPEYAEN